MWKYVLIFLNVQILYWLKPANLELVKWKDILDNERPLKPYIRYLSSYVVIVSHSMLV